jgi:hypothetical protein
MVFFNHFDWILSLNLQLCINFPQILQVALDSLEVASEISRAMGQGATRCQMWSQGTPMNSPDPEACKLVSHLMPYV